MASKRRKICLVPNCQSRSDRNPEKHFIGIPSAKNPKLKETRQAWLKAIGHPVDHLRDEAKDQYVCEDHFNLKEDMRNYYEIQLANYKFYRCKPGVVPSQNLNLPFKKKKTTKRTCIRKINRGKVDNSLQFDVKGTTLRKVNNELDASNQFVLMEENEIKTELPDSDDEIPPQELQPELMLELVMKEGKKQIKEDEQNGQKIKTEIPDQEDDHDTEENIERVVETEIYNDYEEVECKFEAEENQLVDSYDEPANISTTEPNMLVSSVNSANLPSITDVSITTTNNQLSIPVITHNLKRTLPSTFKQLVPSRKIPNILKRSIPKDTSSLQNKVVEEVKLNTKQKNRKILPKRTESQINILSNPLLFVPTKIPEEKDTAISIQLHHLINESTLSTKLSKNQSDIINKNQLIQHVPEVEDMSRRMIFLQPNISSNPNNYNNHPLGVQNSSGQLLFLTSQVSEYSNNVQSEQLLFVLPEDKREHHQSIFEHELEITKTQRSMLHVPPTTSENMEHIPQTKQSVQKNNLSVPDMCVNFHKSALQQNSEIIIKKLCKTPHLKSTAIHQQINDEIISKLPKKSSLNSITISKDISEINTSKQLLKTSSQKPPTMSESINKNISWNSNLLEPPSLTPKIIPESINEIINLELSKTHPQEFSATSKINPVDFLKKQSQKSQMIVKQNYDVVNSDVQNVYSLLNISNTETTNKITTGTKTNFVPLFNEQIHPIIPNPNLKHESTNTDKIITKVKSINTDLLDADQIQYFIDTKLLNETFPCIKTEPVIQLEVQEASQSSEHQETICDQNEDKEMQEGEEGDESDDNYEVKDSEVFKQMCVNVTREKHDLKLCKYLGLAKNNKWFIKSMEKDLIKLKKNEEYVLEYRDIIELVLRKKRLNEEYYILGDAYGISAFDAEKLCDEFSTLIKDSMESIGLEVGLMYNTFGFYCV